MTLDDAIEHCKETIDRLGCSDCSKEHEQLMNWLIELKQLRLDRQIMSMLP